MSGDDRPNGGQAFPQFTEDAWGNARVKPGMSLRDYLAGQALVQFGFCITISSPGVFDEVADRCYAMADAMLRAREK